MYKSQSILWLCMRCRAAPPLMHLCMCMWMNERPGRQRREREINLEPPAQLIEMSRKEWLSINHKLQLNRESIVPRPALCLLSETRVLPLVFAQTGEKMHYMNAICIPQAYILYIIWFANACVYFRFWQ